MSSLGNLRRNLAKLLIIGNGSILESKVETRTLLIVVVFPFEFEEMNEQGVSECKDGIHRIWFGLAVTVE